MDLYYKIKSFFINLKWMLPAAWKFRPWDYTYNIELFANSLERTAHCMLEDGVFKGINSTKYGRRCLYAAKCLKNYYVYDTLDSINDKSYMSLIKNNPSKFSKVLQGVFTDYSVLEYDYKISKEYYNKMFKLIHERSEKAEKERKKELWNYINKHIESWWE